MIWRNGKFLYRGCICNSFSRKVALYHFGRIEVYAFPVPGGKLVDFNEDPNYGWLTERPTLYKVNVKLKPRTI